MARAHTKCSECGDLMWFGVADIPPQAVQCACNATRLTEDGPEGPWVALSQAEIDSLPE